MGINKTYDLVIAGAGPGGLMAAKTAGENGLTVALLERKEHIPEILRACGMMIVTLSSEYMGERVKLNPREGRLCFPHHGFSIKYSGPHKDFFAWELYSPSGNLVTLGDYSENIKKGPEGRASAVYDKKVLLTGLLEEVEKLNVDIFPATNVINVKKGNYGVEVVTAEGRVFKGAFVIAADGRNSRIACVLGLNQGRGFFGTANSQGYDMEGLDLPHPHALVQMLIESGRVPKLGFIIPRAWGDNLYMVIVSDLDPTTDREAYFDYVTTKSRFAPWFKRARRVKRVGVCGNMWAPIEDPFKDNVLLVGDAGWCQEAEMTGAVMCGWRAAHAVTSSLIEGKVDREGVQGYIDWWKKYHLEKLDYSVFLKNLVMPIICTDEEIDYVFSKMSEPLPTRLDPYETPRFSGEAMQKVMPIIYKERPQLVTKLMKFSNFPLEIILNPTIRAGFPSRFSM
jgi:digeranylgeranylglycerophospholipid reductase